MNPDVTNSSSLPTPEPAAVGATAVDASMRAMPLHSSPTPQLAGDNDRIEQEWVTKTKQVLLATRNDPYEQNRQLAALRADYMMKRYNKEIKLGE
jgi:hypothetical protein